MTTTTTRRRLAPAALVAAAAAIALLLTWLTPPPAAQAYSISAQVVPVTSGCTTSKTWKGSVKSYNGHWATYKVKGASGKVKYCATKLRIVDANKKADYYVLDATAEWSTSSNGSTNFTKGSPFWTRIATNKDPRANEFNATRTFKKDSGCAISTIGVSASFAGFGVSATQRLRCATTVSRNSLTNRSAKWSSGHVTKLAKVELQYGQAVNQGVKPKFSIGQARPYYTYSWKGQKACRGATCWTEQVPKQTRSTATITLYR